MASDPSPDRRWRGRPPVPGFRFDRRGSGQRRAAARLPLVGAAALGSYLALEPLLVRWAGGVWGELLVLVLVGAPLGAAWAMADGGTSVGSAWKTGALLAFASAALHAWIFTGAWV